jgi:hypothetical protein
MFSFHLSSTNWGTKAGAGHTEKDFQDIGQKQVYLSRCPCGNVIRPIVPFTQAKTCVGAPSSSSQHTHLPALGG